MGVVEHQKELPVVIYDVLPFTTAQSLVDWKPMARGEELKAIKSKNPEIKRETSLNRYLGVDLRIKEVSEDRNIAIYQLWHDLRHHVPTFMSSPPCLWLTARDPLFLLPTIRKLLISRKLISSLVPALPSRKAWSLRSLEPGTLKKRLKKFAANFLPRMFLPVSPA